MHIYSFLFNPIRILQIKCFTMQEMWDGRIQCRQCQLYITVTCSKAPIKTATLLPIQEYKTEKHRVRKHNIGSSIT